MSKYSCQFISLKGGNILERPNRSEYPSHSWKVTTLPINWAHVSQDQWVLDTIQTGIPEGAHTAVSPKSGHSISRALFKRRYSQCFKKGRTVPNRCIQGLEPSHGGMRPVINLKGLNEFIIPYHFQDGRGTHPEGSPQEGRLDDKSRPIPIHQPNRQFLWFGRYYQFNCLPFGLPGSLPETSNIPAQRAGGKASGIHRRHSNYGRIRGTGEGPHPRSDLNWGSYYTQ